MGVFPTKTIDEVTETLIDYRGKTPPKSASGVQLITAKVIKEGFIQGGNHEYISEETYESWMRRGLPQQWDILVTTEAPLGEVAQLRTPEGVALAQRVILLRGDPSIIDQQYYFQALKSPFVQGQLQARATGTTVLGIKQSELRKVEIPYYPLPTQRKIAAVLSAYDDLIENNTRRIAILEQMAQLLYREWFVHFRFPGHESVRMVDSELGPIPKGWQVGAFSDLAVIKRDNVKPDESEDETFEYYSFPAFDSNRMPAFERGAEIRSNKYLVHRGSVLLSKLNPHISRVWLPFPDTEHCAVASTEFLILLPKEPFNCAYLFSLCNSQDFLQRFAGLATGTSTSHQRVKPGSLQNMQVPLPSRHLVQEFGSLATPVFRAIHTLQSKNAVLSRTRDLLLPRLISGELDVSELAIDVGEEDDHGWGNTR
jgi:type I restriction enzyme S subunit